MAGGRRAAATPRPLITITDFLGTDYVAMLRATGIDLPDLRTIVIARGQAAEGTESWTGFLARATDDGRAEVDRRRGAVTADDPSDILFTAPSITTSPSATAFISASARRWRGPRDGSRSTRS